VKAFEEKVLKVTMGVGRRSSFEVTILDEGAKDPTVLFSKLKTGSFPKSSEDMIETVRKAMAA